MNWARHQSFNTTNSYFNARTPHFSTAAAPAIALTTVFADVHSDMTLAREETFGPILSIIPFEDFDDAIRIANGNQYGLASGVHKLVVLLLEIYRLRPLARTQGFDIQITCCKI